MSGKSKQKPVVITGGFRRLGQVVASFLTRNGHIISRSVHSTDPLQLRPGIRLVQANVRDNSSVRERIRDVLESECRRLGRQALFFCDGNEVVLRAAGVGRGMRVLDLGCGRGDTSLLIANIVGPSGLVMGVDASVEAIGVAEKRATTACQCYWTRFFVADLDKFVLDQVFDMVIGRPMSLHAREPAVALQRLASFVPPGGVIALTTAAS